MAEASSRSASKAAAAASAADVSSCPAEARAAACFSATVVAPDALLLEDLALALALEASTAAAFSAAAFSIASVLFRPSSFMTPMSCTASTMPTAPAASAWTRRVLNVSMRVSISTTAPSHVARLGLEAKGTYTKRACSGYATGSAGKSLGSAALLAAALVAMAIGAADAEDAPAPASWSLSLSLPSSRPPMPPLPPPAVRKLGVPAAAEKSPPKLLPVGKPPAAGRLGAPPDAGRLGALAGNEKSMPPVGAPKAAALLPLFPPPMSPPLLPPLLISNLKPPRPPKSKAPAEPPAVEPKPEGADAFEGADALVAAIGADLTAALWDAAALAATAVHRRPHSSPPKYLEAWMVTVAPAACESCRAFASSGVSSLCCWLDAASSGRSVEPAPSASAREKSPTTMPNLVAASALSVEVGGTMRMRTSRGTFMRRPRTVLTASRRSSTREVDSAVHCSASAEVRSSSISARFEESDGCSMPDTCRSNGTAVGWAARWGAKDATCSMPCSRRMACSSMDCSRSRGRGT